MLSMPTTRPIRSYPVAKPKTRKYGEAQRQILFHIIRHKETHNGRSPTYAELAEYMEYSHPNCARNVVLGIINRNRPGRPYRVYVQEYGLRSLEIDEQGHLIVPDGQFLIPDAKAGRFDGSRLR